MWDAAAGRVPHRSPAAVAPWAETDRPAPAAESSDPDATDRATDTGETQSTRPPAPVLPASGRRTAINSHQYGWKCIPALVWIVRTVPMDGRRITP